MPIWKYLHILSMVSAVTLLVGGDVFFHALRRTGDRAALARFLRTINPLFTAGVALLTLGVGFGLLTAASGGWNFTAGWLLATYAIVATLYLVGLLVGLPYYRGAAAELRQDPSPGTDGRAADPGPLGDVRGPGSMLASVVGYVAIIFLMVVKPFA